MAHRPIARLGCTEFLEQGYHFCFVFSFFLPQHTNPHTMKVVYQSHSVTNPFYCCHGGRNSCVQATLENVKRTENVEYQLQTATGIKCNHIFKILKERRETNGTLRIEFRIEKVSANFDSQPFVLLVSQPGTKGHV